MDKIENRVKPGISIKSEQENTRATVATYWVFIYLLVLSTSAAISISIIYAASLPYPFLFALALDAVGLFMHGLALIENERIEKTLEIRRNKLIYTVVKRKTIPFILSKLFKRQYKPGESPTVKHITYEIKFISEPDDPHEDPIPKFLRWNKPPTFSDLSSLTFKYVKGHEDREVYFPHFHRKDIEKIRQIIDDLT